MRYHHLALLALAAACGEDGAPPAATLLIRTVTTGDTLDADGYVATIAGTRYPVGVTDTLRITSLPAGAVAVTLGDVAVNCRLEGEPGRAATLALGAEAEIGYAVTCVAARFNRIAFTRSDPVNGDPIYHMDLDGGDTVRVTPRLNTGTVISWSPDGTRIAYSVGQLGYADVYLVDPDGSDSVKLTDGSDYYNAPTWSPDGGRLAVVADQQGGVLYVMNADGSGLAPVDTILTGVRPMISWSPDGARLAVTSNADGDDEIYLVNADGSGFVPLTSDPASDTYPSWSPDGGRIAFVRAGAAGSTLRVMNADGSGDVPLAGPGQIYCAAWSPDGSRIAFNRDYDIWVMNADGSGAVNLTPTAVSEGGCPAWAPLR